MKKPDIDISGLSVLFYLTHVYQILYPSAFSCNGKTCTYCTIKYITTAHPWELINKGVFTVRREFTHGSAP